MIGMIARKLNREDEGFTLIELMVVVLIIGILVAIALPTFLGARARAQDKGAESNLRNGIAAAKTIFTDASTYATFTPAAALAVEPSLNWQAAAIDPKTIAGNNVVTITVATATDVVLVDYSQSGKYFCIHDSSTLGTQYNSGATFAGVSTVALCNAVQWP